MGCGHDEPWGVWRRETQGERPRGWSPVEDGTGKRTGEEEGYPPGSLSSFFLGLTQV